MPEPYNYLTNLPNPGQQMLAGLQSGMGMAQSAQQMRLAQEQADQMAMLRGAQMEQEQAQTAKIRSEMERQQAFQGEIGKLSKEGFTPQGLVDVMTRFPEMAKQLEKPYELLGAEQRKQSIDILMPVVSALNAGDRVNAAAVLDEKIAAFRNAGKDREADAGEKQRDMILHGDLNAAQTMMNSSLALAMGPDKYNETFGKLEEQRRERQLEPSKLSKAQADALKADFDAKIAGVTAEFAPQQQRAEIGAKNASAANMYSQITDRAKRLGLDERKFADESARAWANIGLDQAKISQLPEPVRKEIDTYVVKAGEAATDAARMREIAKRYESEVKTSGAAASLREAVARMTGKTNAISDLRSEYARMRNAQILKNLPPGPASDKDIAFAEKGFPDENANPEQVASFLTGFAKIRELEAKQNEARAAWTSSFRGLGNATMDTTIGGVDVRSGEKFNDFVQRYQGEETAAPAQPTAPKEPPANMPLGDGFTFRGRR